LEAIVATTLTKFEKLSDSLSYELRAARGEIEDEAKKDVWRRSAMREHQTFVWLLRPIMAIYLTLPPLIALLLAKESFEVAAVTAIWIVIQVFGFIFSSNDGNPDITEVACDSDYTDEQRWRDMPYVNRYQKKFGDGIDYYWRAKKIAPVNQALWMQCGTVHFLWAADWYYKAKIAHFGKNPVSGDDRYSSINRLLANLTAWDQDVKLINRLIDQVDLNLIPEDDVRKHYERLRADEEFLKRNIAYVERLLEEGPLGTSTGLAESPVKAIEQVDERMQEIDANRKGLREFAMRLDAMAEVSRLK
jgi:hypothetical protein